MKLRDTWEIFQNIRDMPWSELKRRFREAFNGNEIKKKKKEKEKKIKNDDQHGWYAKW